MALSFYILYYYSNLSFLNVNEEEKILAHDICRSLLQGEEVLL